MRCGLIEDALHRVTVESIAARAGDDCAVPRSSEAPEYYSKRKSWFALRPPAGQTTAKGWGRKSLPISALTSAISQ